MNIRIWHIEDHDRSEEAYKAINTLCGERQHFIEFLTNEKLCIAWQNADNNLYSAVDEKMKVIAIADLTDDQEAIAAYKKDVEEWGETSRKMHEMLQQINPVKLILHVVGNKIKSLLKK